MGDTLAVAAGVTGVSVSSIHRYRRSHEGFARELEAARRQARVIEHHAPRMMVTRAGQSAEGLDMSTGEVDATQRDAFLALLSRHANDGDSKGCAKALDILAQLHLAREFLDLKAAAKRDAAQLELEGDTSEPLQVRLMVPTAQPAVVDTTAREVRNDS